MPVSLVRTERERNHSYSSQIFCHGHSSSTKQSVTPSYDNVCCRFVLLSWTPVFGLSYLASLAVRPAGFLLSNIFPDWITGKHWTRPGTEIPPRGGRGRSVESQGHRDPAVESVHIWQKHSPQISSLKSRPVQREAFLNSH